MIPYDLPNPFHTTGALKDTFAVPPGHVPELHAPVLATIRRALAACRAGGSPTSVLVRGETGSGKTHLLAQLRDELKADPTTLVVGINFFGAYPGGLWRHVRKSLVTELIRVTPGATATAVHNPAASATAAFWTAPTRTQLRAPGADA